MKKVKYVLTFDIKEETEVNMEVVRQLEKLVTDRLKLDSGSKPLNVNARCLSITKVD